MKNKLTAIVAVTMSVLLALSVFTACSLKKDSGESTTLTPDDTWRPGADETYEPVEIEDVELVAIVSKALGEDAKDFNGDLSSLSSDQLNKVREVAREQGYIVETDESGETVIKKNDNVKVSEADSEKASEILSEAGVSKPSGVSREQYEKISKVADERGATAVTDKDGNVKIVETTVVSTTAAPSAPANTTAAPGTTARNETTTEKTTAPTTRATSTRNPGTTPSQTFNAGTAATIAPKIKALDPASHNSVTNGDHVIFNDITKVAGGSVSVGNTAESGSKTAAYAVKFDDNQKKLWADKIAGDDFTQFEAITTLADGSVLAVGETLAENIVSDSAYKCKGTVEGLMVKYSPDGKREWIKLFGGSKGDIIYAAAPTPDGGFVIGGKSDSNDFDMKGIGSDGIKAFVCKMDSAGNKIWGSAMTGSKHSAVRDIATTSAGTIYAAIEVVTKDGDYASFKGAQSPAKFTVVEKLSEKGERLWTREFYESAAVNMSTLCAANSNGCVVAGSYSAGKDGNTGTFAGFYNGGSRGTYDGVIAKLNANGDIVWMLPLIGFQNDYITGVSPITGGYAVTGYTTSTNRDFSFTNNGDFDSYVGAVSENGRLMAMRSFGGSGSDRAMNLCSDGANGIYSCGISYSPDGAFSDCSEKSDGDTPCAFVFKYSSTLE